MTHFSGSSMTQISLKNKAFIFDMDGVLLNSMEGHYLAWQRAAQARGFSIDRLDVYLREGEKGAVSGRDFLAMNNLDASPEAVARILADKEHEYASQPPGHLYPFVKEILKLIAANDSPLALVTGTSRDELDKTLPPDIAAYFPVKVTGNIVTHGKPHPEPYLMALDKLGIVAEDAVVIENAPYGIRSAKAAGIFTLALCTSLPEEHIAQADIIFHTHKELYTYLQSALA